MLTTVDKTNNVLFLSGSFLPPTKIAEYTAIEFSVYFRKTFGYSKPLCDLYSVLYLYLIIFSYSEVLTIVFTMYTVCYRR